MFSHAPKKRHKMKTGATNRAEREILMQQERNYRYAPGIFSGDTASPRCSARDRDYTRQCPSAERNECPEKDGMVLAMAYVRSQPFDNMYPPKQAWDRGTLFMDLDLPYGGKC